MCASIFPFALSTHASIATVSLTLRKSFVICPLRNRNRSVPVIRNFARSERSRELAFPAREGWIILVQTRTGSGVVRENRGAIVSLRQPLHHLPLRKRAKAVASRDPHLLQPCPAPILLGQYSAQRRRLSHPALVFAALRKALHHGRANICAQRTNNHRLRDPTAFAQATDRGPRRSLPSPNNATKQPD